MADLRGGYGKVWRETNRVLAGLSRGERDQERLELARGAPRKALFAASGEPGDRPAPGADQG